MEILRLVVATLVMGALCFHLLKEIAAGLRKGKIRYGRGPGERLAHRRQQPLLFWFLVFVFAVLAIASLAVMAWVAYGTFSK